MPTIVSCPKCRDQVTLPPEPYSGLICPHCQAEFTMQPTLRQPAAQYSSLRQELAREARAGLAPQSAGGEVALAEVGDRVIALPPRRTGPLTLACHVIGLLGGGALGIVAGYCLLTYWGGAHFNVLELPLPWLPPMAARSSGDETSQSPQAAAVRPSGTAEAPKTAPSHTAPSSTASSNAAPKASPSKDAGGASSTTQPRSQTAAPQPPPRVLIQDKTVAGPRLLAASHADTAARSAAGSSSTSLPAKARHRATSQSSDSHPLEELTRAAAAARDALACPTCKSTGLVTRSVSGRESAQRCPVCRGAAGAGITAEVYAKLCHLAEVTTDADTADEDLDQARKVLSDVFHKAADRAEKRDAIGRHAAQRMTAPYPLRSDATGILLVGTIDRKESAGEYHVTRLVLLGEPTAVVVLSGAPMLLQPGERAIIAGRVLSDPALDLPGYVGPRGPAVWGGMPLRLEE